ncbi:MAG: hypothetical protein MUD05_09655 [Candidatus Nanopelagicales bacterium]|nr:hypothetical protein [Candidatus Nanopelagicales bacterium]
MYAADAYRFGDHDPLVIGLDLATPVSPPPVTPPPAVVPKQAQTAPKPPKRIKKRGVTVLVPKGARTSVGLPISAKVKTKGKVKVIRKGGTVKVRTFGKKGWRLVLTRTAPGNETYEPFSARTVYVNGKRR